MLYTAARNEAHNKCWQCLWNFCLAPSSLRSSLVADSGSWGCYKHCLQTPHPSLPMGVCDDKQSVFSWAILFRSLCCPYKILVCLFSSQVKQLNRAPCLLSRACPHQPFFTTCECLCPCCHSGLSPGILFQSTVFLNSHTQTLSSFCLFLL